MCNIVEPFTCDSLCRKANFLRMLLEKRQQSLEKVPPTPLWYDWSYTKHSYNRSFYLDFVNHLHQSKPDRTCLQLHQISQIKSNSHENRWDPITLPRYEKERLSLDEHYRFAKYGLAFFPRELNTCCIFLGHNQNKEDRSPPRSFQPNIFQKDLLRQVEFGGAGWGC